MKKNNVLERISVSITDPDVQKIISKWKKEGYNLSQKISLIIKESTVQ